MLKSDRLSQMSDHPATGSAKSFFDGLAQRVAVMGIVNVTPDSFSGDGTLAGERDPVQQAETMQACGADILDIGGESTRPGSTPVPLEEEAARVIPVVKAISAAVSVPLSVDTYKSALAREAIGAGACIVNDVWGLQKDPEMAETVAATGAGLIIMHNREKADDSLDIMGDIERFLTRSLDIARRAGIPTDLIALDPGIGFGKTIRQNFVILNRLEQLKAFGLPVLIGLSRKRFIGALLDRDIDSRLPGTIAANLFAIHKGASIVRVHDVGEHADAVRMTAAIESEFDG